MTKPIVVLRSVAGKPRLDAYEGWDRVNRRRVIVHRHRDDSAARREFANLERTAACDHGLVVGPAFHRLCFDAEVDFGGYPIGPEPEHPSIVLQTHPGTGRTLRPERRYRTDAELAALIRPVLTSVNELHSKTDLVHMGVSPGSLARMWSGRCTLMDLRNATVAGQRLELVTVGTGLYTCPETVRSGVAHRGMDMWSCGVLLYRLAHRSFAAHPFDEALERPLWQEPSAREVVRTVSTMRYSPDMWLNPNAPKAAALCEALLDPYLEARPSAKEALWYDLFA